VALTIAGPASARCAQLAWSLVNLTQLAAAALRTVSVEDAGAFHHHQDARLDQRNGGLTVVPRGVDQGFDLGRRQQ
jgi:hypothetical protein